MRAADTAVQDHPISAQEQLTRNVNQMLAFTGKKQADLAASLHISQPYISMLLAGKREWQIEMLDHIAAFFLTTVSALFVTGDGAAIDRRRVPDRRRDCDRRRKSQT